ncbi:hypothetical protein BGZ54_002628 [Gamsiella multidivaricata]|nr:hypothetical protein BGZ54_002628 [Gamsiella multidivaricata]
MRCHVALIILSMYVCAVAAGVSGAGHHGSKAVAGPTNSTVDAPGSAGSKAPAEKTADAVLSCLDGCAGNVGCQNECVGKNYNVNLAAVPPSSSMVSVLGPTAVTTATVGISAGGVPAATATAAATGSVVPTGSTATGRGSGAVLATAGIQVAGAMVAAVGVAGLFIGL